MGILIHKKAIVTGKTNLKVLLTTVRAYFWFTCRTSISWRIYPVSFGTCNTLVSIIQTLLTVHISTFTVIIVTSYIAIVRSSRCVWTASITISSGTTWNTISWTWIAVIRIIFEITTSTGGAKLRIRSTQLTSFLLTRLTLISGIDTISRFTSCTLLVIWITISTKFRTLVTTEIYWINSVSTLTTWTFFVIIVASIAICRRTFKALSIWIKTISIITTSALRFIIITIWTACIRTQFACVTNQPIAKRTILANGRARITRCATRLITRLAIPTLKTIPTKTPFAEESGLIFWILEIATHASCHIRRTSLP